LPCHGRRPVPIIHWRDSGLALPPPRPAGCCCGRATSGTFFFATRGLLGSEAAWAGAIAEAAIATAPAMAATRQTEGDFPGALLISQSMYRV